MTLRTIRRGRFGRSDGNGTLIMSLYGIVEYKGDMYLAAGDDGVCVLRSNKVKAVRDTFGAVGVYRLPERLAFTMANEGDEPTFVVYDPASQPPWCGWTV
jgi:hypothetical protein